MIFSFMEKYWKQLTFAPILLLVVSSALIISNIASKGSFLERDVELKGGKLIEAEVSGVPEIDANVRTLAGGKRILIEIPSESDEKEIISALKSSGVLVGEPTVRSFGPALGDIFWRQAQTAILAAFLTMSLFVFILFRSPVPCGIVILAAATDIIGTIAVLDLIGIKLSLPVLAALLMIIGYSVDTDILLTSNLLKGSGEVNEKIRNSMKTGLTMSATTLAALSVMYLISGSFVLSQIALVLIIGVVIDIPATWLTNAGLLRWWLIKND